MVDCKNSGFSLVEISVVILIVAVLLGSSVVSYSKMNDKQQRQKTEYLIEEVQRALIGYAITNGYLPCPDV
ncbi:MAG TPA: prepilin-type N-terminal cleavage/methylation domain-containing protein, partial [Magnetococcales bacterium]|nr:prepilin-type N-terminal cleavage/methylation domain-containing protein [Magnetococcales bacterium]